MDGLGDIVGVLGSAASGGVFGLFGSLLGVGAKWLQRREDRKARREEHAHEERLLELEIKRQSQTDEHELALVASQGSWQGLKASVEAEGALQGAGKTTNNMRALFRPFLTVLLWVLAGWVFYHITSGGLREWLTDVEVVDLIRYMVYTVFFSAATATAWWFGDRAFAPPGYKNR